MANVHLFIIDPQHDFCHPDGSLFVPGAPEDMDRVALMIKRGKSKFADIHVSLDSHQKVHIANPIWFVDGNGNAPAPLTNITAADMESGRWSARYASQQGYTLSYLKALEAGGRYPHTIWPEHCFIGTEGATVVPVLQDALSDWCSQFATVDYVAKGSNPYTEHFSAIQAEVPYPKDPGTQPNMRFMQTLETADIIGLCGEALQFCVGNTGRDVVKNFSDPKYAKKLVILKDGTSPVVLPNDAHVPMCDAFLKEMEGHGATITTTTEFLNMI